MPGRSLHAATSAALGESVIRPVWFVRLDIQGDPILLWTGIGDKTMAGTGDSAMDGQTFMGLGNIGEIGAIVDAKGGSQAVMLTLPGVDLLDEALVQVVWNANTWQFRQAWMWMALLDASNAIIGQPTRVKTGRMDQMVPREDDKGTGIVSVNIESQQAYAGEPLNTRWSEQKSDIDATDISQDFVWDIANKDGAVGGANTGVSGTGGRGNMGIRMATSRR